MELKNNGLEKCFVKAELLSTLAVLVCFAKHKTLHKTLSMSTVVKRVCLVHVYIEKQWKSSEVTVKLLRMAKIC